MIARTASAALLLALAAVCAAQTPAAPSKVIVYDFYADWCGPCKQFAPTFDAWRQKYTNEKTAFARINVDENKALAQKYNITSIPTVVIVRDGREVARSVGAPSETWLKRYLP